MSRDQKGRRRVRWRDSEIAELAISKPQIDSLSDPRVSMRSLVSPTPQPRRFVARPWFVWKDHPEVARGINEQLAPADGS